MTHVGSSAAPRSSLAARVGALALVMLSACVRQAAPPFTAEPVFTGPADAQVPVVGIALVVYKERRVLTVTSDGTPIYEFPMVVGRRANGPKRFEGDMRTPEGLYHVTGKHPHRRWGYFIEIDYPNGDDVAQYAAAVTDGSVPVIDGEFAGIGGRVGIHGSDKPLEQERGVDWTRGCVALRTDDVARIYALVDRGTPVLILP